MERYHATSVLSYLAQTATERRPANESGDLFSAAPLHYLSDRATRPGSAFTSPRHVCVMDVRCEQQSGCALVSR